MSQKMRGLESQSPLDSDLHRAVQCRDTAIANRLLELGRSHKVSMKKKRRKDSKRARAKGPFIDVRCRQEKNSLARHAKK